MPYPIPLGYAETVHEQALVDASYQEPVKGGDVRAVGGDEQILRLFKLCAPTRIDQDCTALPCDIANFVGELRALAALSQGWVSVEERKKVARYDFLRERFKNGGLMDGGADWDCTFNSPYGCYEDEDSLDEAIDAVLAAPKAADGEAK